MVDVISRRMMAKRIKNSAFRHDKLTSNGNKPEPIDEARFKSFRARNFMMVSRSESGLII